MSFSSSSESLDEDSIATILSDKLLEHRWLIVLKQLCFDVFVFELLELELLHKFEFEFDPEPLLDPEFELLDPELKLFEPFEPEPELELLEE